MSRLQQAWKWRRLWILHIWRLATTNHCSPSDFYYIALNLFCNHAEVKGSQAPNFSVSLRISTCVNWQRRIYLFVQDRLSLVRDEWLALCPPGEASHNELLEPPWKKNPSGSHSLLPGIYHNIRSPSSRWEGTTEASSLGLSRVHCSCSIHGEGGAFDPVLRATREDVTHQHVLLGPAVPGREPTEGVTWRPL